MLLWALPILGGIVFLVVVGAVHRRVFLRDWEHLLSGRVADRIDALREHVETDQLLAERLLDKARRAHEASDPARGGKLLERSARTIEEAVPDRVDRLHTMATWARMASALVPVRAVQVRALRLTLLRWVAGAGAVLHGLAVSFEDRFVLRLGVLRWAYRALGFEARLVARDAAARQLAPPVWERAEGCVADLKTLDAEHVQSFSDLMVSLAHDEQLPARPASEVPPRG